MISKKYIRQSFRITFSVILIAAILVMSTGCTEYIRERAFERVEDYVYGFVEEISTNPLTVMSDNSIKKLELPELSDEQQEIFDSVYTCKMKIAELELGEDNKSADCKLKLSYKDISEKFEATEYHTVKDFKSEIGDMKSKKKNMTLHLEKDGKQWKFSDLQEVIDVTTAGYSSLNICDEDGFPVELTTDYFDNVYVEALWYDPMFSTPLHLNKLTDPVALQCAFYFNTPVNLRFEVVLRDDNDKKLASYDIEIKDSVIVVVDFSADFVGVSKFSSGNYTIELRWNDEVFAKTEEPLEVK